MRSSHLPYSQLLRRVPLFRDLEEADLGKLAQVCREEVFEAGEVVIAVGEPGHTLFVLLEGTVQVLYPARSGDYELARLGPGDFFGEMALLNDKPRSATIRTMEPIRTLTVEKEDFRRIIAESPRVALTLLEMMSVRIRNADEQISGLSEKAMRDSLTGLLNRRAFHERLNEEADRCRRYGDSFSLILLDVDRFKAVNDTFGHDVGDEILRWIGRVLSEHTRSADAPFRVGGEEFAVLAPATTAKVARTAADRLVATLHEATPPLDLTLHISMSAGYASAPEHGSDPELLYTLADRALLKAKREGRNQVCDPEAPPVEANAD